MEKKRQCLLSSIPSIHSILTDVKKETDLPHPILHQAATGVLQSLREEILSLPKEKLTERVIHPSSLIHQIRIQGEDLYQNLTPVINATGVLLHTNLGRALLSRESREKAAQLSSCYSNLEYNVKKGERGSRYDHVKELLCLLCGAQDALVVNNNAAAVLLILETFAWEKEVIVSRGELIEIGDSFRLPDIMSKAGARLVEVGTTNRTHLRDYQNAVGEETALILKSHQSNFQIQGFTRHVPLKELQELGEKEGLIVYYDMGSGNLVPFPHEPTVKEITAQGISLVSFSGDKLLGGPQAGIIVGEKNYLSRLRKNPLTRALRVGKLILAALEETLKHYLNQELEKIPLYQALSTPMERLEERGRRLLQGIEKNQHLQGVLVKGQGKIGGGSLPLTQIESRQLQISSSSFSAQEIRWKLLAHGIPIIPRVKEDLLFLDLLTIQEEELPELERALENL